MPGRVNTSQASKIDFDFFLVYMGEMNQSVYSDNNVLIYLDMLPKFLFAFIIISSNPYQLQPKHFLPQARKNYDNAYFSLINV